MARGGGRGWSKRAVLHPRRWVVERGLPRLFSVSRTSGLRRLFSFLSPLSLSLSLLLLFLSCFPLLLVSPLSSILFGSSNPFISRSRFCGNVPFFLFRPACSPHSPTRSPAPLSRPYAFPASPALRCSDRLRIHCEIDRLKRVPEWPERTKATEGNGVGRGI